MFLNIKFKKNKNISIYNNTIMKKILIIIYKFNILNKKILFLNLSKKQLYFLKILKFKTNHKFMPINFWLNGLLSNFLITKYLSFTNKFKFLFNLNLKIDFSLIIIFNQLKFKRELLKSNLLTLLLYQNFNINNIIFGIMVPVKTQKLIFYLLIYILLKKK